MTPCPHRCPIWHEPPGGQQARVVPALEAPTTLLKVGDHLHPLLKVSILHLHVVLKMDNPVGMGLHLPMGDVE
jgi:hypothetical protein